MIWRWPEAWGGHCQLACAYESCQLTDAVTDLFRSGPDCHPANAKSECGAVGIPHAFRILGSFDLVDGSGYGLGGWVCGAAAIASNDAGDLVGSYCG